MFGTGNKVRTMEKRMEPTPKKTSTLKDLLEIALAKERAAVELYEEMLRHASGAMMRDLIAGMRDDEIRHVRAIEKKMNDLLDGRL
jgi:rubrerythrin